MDLMPNVHRNASMGVVVVTIVKKDSAGVIVAFIHHVTHFFFFYSIMMDWLSSSFFIESYIKREIGGGFLDQRLPATRPGKLGDYVMRRKVTGFLFSFYFSAQVNVITQITNRRRPPVCCPSTFPPQQLCCCIFFKEQFFFSCIIANKLITNQSSVAGTKRDRPPSRDGITNTLVADDPLMRSSLNSDDDQTSGWPISC